MKIREGLAYHMTDKYYELVQDCDVKQKRYGRTFPAYCCCKDANSPIIWMIPLSVNVEKYKAPDQKEMARYGHCLSVTLGRYDAREGAFHIQGMFPTTRKYVLHAHTRAGKCVRISHSLKSEIRDKFEKMLELHHKGIICVLSDIDRIEQLLLSV